jgi:SAM-dependent methyltransferase
MTNGKEVRLVTVAEGYARWAAEYDGYRNPLIAVEEETVRDLLGDVAGKRVLDAACGTGRHAAWLLERGARVVAVDESAEMLAHAKAKCPALDARACSVMNLRSLELRGFDVVLNALMAEHVEDLDRLIASLVSALATGGTLVLSVWHPFMILKGVPTHYEDRAANVEYVLPSHRHLVGDYWRAMRAAGLEIDAMVERVADDALILRMPHMKKHAGMPLALVIRATASRSS